MRFEHPLHPEDAAPAEANRLARAPVKGLPLGIEARESFAAKKLAIAAPQGVSFSDANVGGIDGVWCKPRNAIRRSAILFFHGGGYSLGSAHAFANFAGQIADRAGAETFVADYRLAPEHRFPSAVEDALAAYEGLAANGCARIAVAGDSAGGGLALSLLAALARSEHGALPRPVAAAVMSPWTDLALTGDSYSTRADADPVFTRKVLQDIAATYLGGERPTHPFASPLYGSFEGLPPIRIDVGDDELVLDDAQRYVARAVEAGVPASVHVWLGMPHVFQTGVGRYVAAEESMAGIGLFLRTHLS